MVFDTQPPSRIIVVCGPTGIGKTRNSIQLARRLGGEIVGADSMQIYRQMDIGTAKPTAEEQAEVCHHLIDVVDPDENFDAADYARLASDTVQNLDSRGTIPVVAGGTGLYIKSLIYGLFDISEPTSGIRERLKAEADKKGLEVLYERLRRIDPETAAVTHANDAFRIIRALEIQAATGTPVSIHRQKHGFVKPRFSAFKIGLTMEREILYRRIDRRVDLMLAEGLLEEVEGLLNKGYSPSLKSMQSIGYRHMVAFIRGEVDWSETVRLLKRDTRRYAKRQFTWFRSDPEIHWIHPGDMERLYPAIDLFLERGAPFVR